jgi:DNA invertase Pin-like site-specific DNA recombinase
MIVIFSPSRRPNPSLGDYVSQRGWKDVAHVHNAEKLMRAVRAGKVKVVLASNLNGLAPDVSKLVDVLREFVDRKIGLIIPDRIDTSKMSRRAYLTLLDAIEEFQRSVASENINAGLRAARKRGVKLGRPSSVNAHHADIARLRAQGLSGRAIGKALGIPSSTVFATLRRARVRADI